MTQFLRFVGTMCALLSFFTMQAQLDANFSVSDSTGCGTLQAQFCDISTTAPGGVITSRSWDLGGAPANGISCPSRVFGTPGTYTICLTVTDDQGNTDTECKDNVLQVFNLPSPEFSASHTLDCVPASIVFTDASSSLDGDIEEWLWGLGGSCGTITITAPTAPAATCTYDLPDFYTVSLTVKDDNGCTNTITKDDYLEMRAVPTPSLSTSSTFGCEPPYTVSFVNTSTITTGIDFVWNFGNGGTYTGESPPDITYNTQGTFDVTLIANDPMTGCADTLFLEDHITIGYPIDFAVSETEGCEGTSVSFTDNSPNVADNVVWDFGDGFSSIDPNPSHTYNISGCHFVKLTRTVGGCTSEKYLPTCINIQGPPSFTVNNDNNSGCSLPHVVNFSSITNDADSWEWDFGDGNTSTAQNPTHSYTTFGDFDVYIVGQNSLGCTDSVFVNTISVEPVEAILADDDISGCAPLEVTLGENSNSVTAITDWQWQLATTSNTFISFSQSPTFTVTDTGVFDVVLTVTNTLGCTDTKTFTGAIQIGENPTLDFVASTTESCVERPIDFTDLSDNTVDYWFWDFGDGNDTEGQNPTHYYLDTGYYDVNLIAASNGCFSSITFDDYIHISAPVSKYNVIKFCDDDLKRKFKDNSVGADSIFWDFGVVGMDSDTSSNPNPEYTYPGPGTYTVTATVYNFITGCSHFRTEEVVVTDPIANFTPSTQVGCVPLQINLSNSSQDANVYYWSSPNGGNFSDENEESPSLTFDSPGAYTDLQLIIKDINNCRDTMILTDTIFVNEIVADINATPAEGCEPLTVGFTDNSSNLFNTNNTWAWDFQDGGTSVDETPTYTFNNSGEYSVSLVVTDSWGCTDEVTIDDPILVSAPVAFFEAAVVENCTFAEIPFSNFSDGQDLTYSWDFGDGETSDEEAPMHVYTAAGTFDVCLTVTDMFGCDHTFCEEDYITIAEPTADFTQDNNFASCPPLTVNFENLSSGAVSYVWDFGDDSGLSSQVNPTHVYTTPGSFEVTLIATNAAGCQDTILFDDLVVLDGPVGEYTIDIDSSCAPAVVTLSGNSVANYIYTWDSGNGIVQNSPTFVSNDQITFTYNQPGIYTPTLSLENSTGCFRTLEPVGAIHVSTISPDFGASETLQCDNNEPITFYNFSSTPDPITDVVWMFESGNPATVNAIEAQTTFPGMGSYDVTMIVDNGICKDTITKQDYINIGPSPVADFSMDINAGCEPLMVNFTDLSSVSVGSIATWNWDFGDGTTDAAQNPSHEFMAGENIVVSLEVTTDEGCTHVFTQNLDVYAPNTIDISDDMAICIGEVAPIEVQVTGDTTGSTFSWSPAAGLSCTDCFNPIAEPGDTTTYTFSMTNAFGCTSSAEVTVQVKPSSLPVVDLTTDTLICYNTGVQLEANAGTGTFTYSWDTSSPGLDCYDCPMPLASPEQLTSYTVTVTNEFDCSTVASVDVDVIDERAPFLGMDRVVCENGSLELNTSMGNDPVWLTTTGLSCTNCPNPIASPPAPTVYYAQVTTDNGCDIIDSVFVDILSPDDVDAGDDKTVCLGESVLLSALGAGDVTWSPAETLSNPNVPNPMATPSETTMYFMTLTNGDCVITDSLLVEITNNTNIELEDITICEGESVELDVIGNADQFEWISDADLSADDIMNPMTSPTETTNYTLVASLGACLPDTATMMVNVIPAPEVELSETATFFPGQSVDVELVAPSNSLYGYLWSPADNISCVTCEQTTITPVDSVVYQVQITDFNTGCSSIDTINFLMMDACPPELIGVPNAFSPNGDGINDVLEIYLSSSMRSEGIISFRVFDRWGAQLFESDNANLGWDGTYQGKMMDIGVYMYFIEYPCPVDGSIQIKRGNVTIIR